MGHLLSPDYPALWDAPSSTIPGERASVCCWASDESGIPTAHRPHLSRDCYRAVFGAAALLRLQRLKHGRLGCDAAQAGEASVQVKRAACNRSVVLSVLRLNAWAPGVAGGGGGGGGFKGLTDTPTCNRKEPPAPHQSMWPPPVDACSKRHPARGWRGRPGAQVRRGRQPRRVPPGSSQDSSSCLSAGSASGWPGDDSWDLMCGCVGVLQVVLVFRSTACEHRRPRQRMSPVAG